MKSAEKLAHDEPATILFTEDEGAIRDMVAAFLSDLGYRVLAAADATDALRVLDEHHEIALLLTDVTLPGLTTGFALAEQVHRKHPAIKIIYTTGHVREIDWPGWDRLLGTLLMKPYRLRDLRRHVEAALHA
jgi:CheY-like chemotaxis protein